MSADALVLQRTTHNLQQGTESWHRHRLSHFNASEASAMMGASKYRSRDDLLREKATGVVPDVSEAQQRLFDAGHAAEAAIRPVIESEINDELYPVTMSVVIDGMQLSASLDGLTLIGETAFEAKLWNEELAAQVQAGELHPHYYWQLEQILLCSGAECVIFATGDGEKLETLEYRAVPGRAEALIAGWRQFAADLRDWQPTEHKPQPVAAPVEGFGVLALRVEGRVLASNLDAFRAGADAFLARLPKPADLQTDQDFADADAAAKACADAEDRIKAAKDMALAQMADVDVVLRTADTIAETIRRARLALEKAVAAEKESRKAAMVRAGVEAVHAHYAEINATLGEHRISVGADVPVAVGASIKGLKTLASMRDRINTAVAAAKIDASQRADKVRANISILSEGAKGRESLFPDHVALCATKSPDDLCNLIAARIADFEKREDERVAREEQRVREAEERGRQQAEAAAKREQEAKAMPTAPPLQQVPASTFRTLPTTAANASARIRLGEINALISPLSITAEGLAQLGFRPAVTEGAAKLYAVSDMPRIVDALVHVLRGATAREVAYWAKVNAKRKEAGYGRRK